MKTILAILLIAALSLFAVETQAAPAKGGDDKAVAGWIEGLNSSEFRRQWYAAYALGMLGPKAAAAMPALHSTLDVNSGKNEYARSMAAWALGQIGPAAESEIPFLAETMRSTKLLAVRRSAAEALGNFAEAAKPAAGDLTKMLDNDDEITRVNAAVALWKIDRDPKAVPALIAMLRGNNSSQTYAAAEALGQMSTDADTVAPALIEALRSPTPDVRRAAARSLGQLGKAAFPAMKKADALRDPDADVRRLVIEALSWMGADALPPLVAGLKDSSPSVRRESARVLGRLGADAVSARSVLETAASDPDENVRDAAAKALRQIPAQ